jgi:hypothetical protein
MKCFARKDDFAIDFVGDDRKMMFMSKCDEVKDVLFGEVGTTWIGRTVRIARSTCREERRQHALCDYNRRSLLVYQRLGVLEVNLPFALRNQVVVPILHAQSTR